MSYVTSNKALSKSGNGLVSQVTAQAFSFIRHAHLKHMVSAAFIAGIDHTPTTPAGIDKKPLPSCAVYPESPSIINMESTIFVTVCIASIVGATYPIFMILEETTLRARLALFMGLLIDIVCSITPPTKRKPKRR